ncbi:MAG: carboxypeptidase-like regulatory domain-containing protein [Reichenbachiella sp.]
MRSVLTILLLISITLTSLAQSASHAVIYGKIISSKDQSPLPFANVIFEDFGTTTNIDGEFVLTVPNPIESQLIIKYIGYNSLHIDIDIDQKNIIQLEESSTILEAITVYSADQIIRDIDNYRQINYEYHNQLMHAYYKESIMVSDEVSYIAEGVFNIFQPTIYSDDKTVIEVKKSRKKELIRLDSTEIPSISGHASDMIDGTTRRKGSFLNPEEIKNYSFSKEELTIYDGREVFVVSFTPVNKKGTSKGLIYIDTESKAVIRTEYYPILDNQYFWTEVKWIEEYTELNGTWNLQRVSYRGEWSNNDKDFSFEAMLVITDSKNVPKKPQMDNELKANVVFFNQASMFNDNFWDGDNFVRLTADEKKSLSQR